jgi:hypothetical protein
MIQTCVALTLTNASYQALWGKQCQTLAERRSQVGTQVVYFSTKISPPYPGFLRSLLTYYYHGIREHKQKLEDSPTVSFS